MPTPQADTTSGLGPSSPHPPPWQGAEPGVVDRGWGKGLWAACTGCVASSAWGSYPSWMNSSRAAHSDTNCGRPLLRTTKDRMGRRSSAPLLDRGADGWGLQAEGLLNRQTPKPQLSPWRGPGLAGCLLCTSTTPALAQST